MSSVPSNLSLVPLTPTEINTVIATIKAKHAALTSRPGFLFVECTLVEPHKYAVLHSRIDIQMEELSEELQAEALRNINWKRRALVVMYSKGKLYEAVVATDGSGILSWNEQTGVQPSMSAEEYLICEKAVKTSPEMLEVLKKYGLNDVNLLTVDAWCTGPWINPGDTPDRRLCRPLLFYSEKQGDNLYARPVEGIDVLVDLELGKVVSVQDKGMLKIPVYDPLSQYNQRMPTAFNREPKTLKISQPNGPSFSVEGNRVQWLEWEFDIGFTSREGVVLHCLSFRDPDRNCKRMVAYRISTGEMVVPYGSPEEPSWRKSAFDAGEDGLGKNANSLRRGENCDCLGLIQYFDAHLINGLGEATTIKNAVCLHEEDFGILYKHSDWRTGEVDVRRARRLVISFITTIANYDYGFYWYLLQDGSIEHEIKATGILSTSVLRADTKKYGVQVAPGLNAITHQHFFAVRLDMAVDGISNSVYEVAVVQEKDDMESNPWGNAFYHKETLLKTEREAQRDINPAESRRWKVVSSSTRNRVGSKCGYELRAGDNCFSMPLARASVSQRAGFLRHHFWVSEYHPEERFPSGNYPNQRSTEDGVSLHTTKRNAPIVNKGNVLSWNF
jgi:primary-amine oxidase